MRYLLLYVYLEMEQPMLWTAEVGDHNGDRTRRKYFQSPTQQLFLPVLEKSHFPL